MPTADSPSTPEVPDTLAAALARHKIELTPKQAKLVEKYARSLWEWNEKINLTRHTDFEKFVSRDLVDTIELAKLLHAEEEVLDVGSGGGVPGLLLAILRPDLTIHLCDSVQKKMKVVEAIARDLHLNVTVFPTRAEEQLKETRYDAVVSRAVGPLDKILTWFRPHWAYIGRLLLIKGPKWTEEHNEAKRLGLMKKLELRVASEYPLPGTESKSVILKIWHQGSREK
ncbi:MAG: 16S rRNA (guanine(527)-N(7))-methyltransferase RsmG [Planctomycetales bacterium]|nr:16S rRNA (guanine(527)-N(7))-methyltransferase RsmG [Planctomycetales bacterium]